MEARATSTVEPHNRKIPNNVRPRPVPNARPRPRAVASKIVSTAEPMHRPVAAPVASARKAGSECPSVETSRSLALVATPSAKVDFRSMECTRMFEALHLVDIEEAASTESTRSIASVRGYCSADLHALAEIAYHYYRAGGLRIAEVIFEGLAAIEPREAYFALALGLVRERLGKRADAKQSFERAAILDPSDPHADLNLAEIELAERRADRALTLCRSAREKAVARKDTKLERKAEALSSVAVSMRAPPRALINGR